MALAHWRQAARARERIDLLGRASWRSRPLLYCCASALGFGNREQTSNRRCHGPRELQRAGTLLWVRLARGPTAGGGCGSDSEGYNERSCFGRGWLRTVKTWRRGAWRTRGLKPRDNDTVRRVRSRRPLSSVFADEWRCPGRNLDAALASGHAWDRGWSLVLAAAIHAPLRMTQNAAQERGVLPQRQRQHD
jgi:hypothetical protein